MNRFHIPLTLMLFLPLAASAQYTFDALQLSQTELRGTSRFVSMAGAFGALGGDISTISQNPGGIGVYRNSDVGITLNLDFNGSRVPGFERITDTRFNVNNAGYVGALKLDGDLLLNFNWGISYNCANSFRRRYSGAASGIPTSITNYIADKAIQDGVTANQLATEDYWTDGGARWSQLLAYKTDMLLADESGKPLGLGFDGVSGEAEFDVLERGHTDAINLTVGGNLANILYWGAGFGFTDIIYEYDKYYGEALYNTIVYNRGAARFEDGDAYLGLSSFSRTVGTGYNFKLGVILKPVNALRFGFAFHTPMNYDMKDTYITEGKAKYVAGSDNTSYELDKTTPHNTVRYRLRTPWRLIGSIAGVVGTKGLLSLDYEYNSTTAMRLKDDYGKEYLDATAEFNRYMQPTHTVRVGGELRLTPNWSLRAGYSYQTSPVAQVVRDNATEVEVSSTCTAYTYDRNIQHITGGIGYRYRHVYCDLAYVHQMRHSTYHAFPAINDLPSLAWDVNDSNNRVSLTLGFRF